jgi:N-methylhydantoinase A
MTENKQRNAGYRVGVDVGGTFTDLVLMAPSGEIEASAKVLTRAADPADGVASGVSALLERAGYRNRSLSEIVHATTLPSNTLIKKTGARVALIANAGFRDILEFGREARYDLYDLTIAPVVPLVPRRLRLEISGRVLADGTVVIPVAPGQVSALAQKLNDDNVEAVAICLLHSYAWPEQEREVKEILIAAGLRCPIILSSGICPEIREFERSSTTVANAYLSPVLGGYLARLESLLANTARSISIIASHGGRISVPVARTRPVELLESGAAAGVLAATRVANELALKRVLSIEMGGTTAKAAIILDGRPVLSRNYEVARLARYKKGSGIPIQMPAIDLIEIGAGGGSIASLNRLGLVAVGPESAEGDPGPACYGLGGERPTVTDACLVLGYLNTDGFLDGEFKLHPAAGWAALEKQLAAPLNLSVESAAQAVFSIAVDMMVNAARIHILEHGVDPSTFVVVAGGGAGPLVAAEFARQLGIAEVVIPPFAGIGAAVGMLGAQPTARIARSRLQPTHSVNWKDIELLVEEMRIAALQELGEAAAGNVELRLSCDMRYRGQGFELTVPFLMPPFPEHAAAELSALFEREYQTRYDRVNHDAPTEVVSWRLEAISPVNAIRLTRNKPLDHAPKPRFRRVLMSTAPPANWPVYRREQLVSEVRMKAPAIVEDRETTTVIPAGNSFWLDQHGNLRLEREG